MTEITLYHGSINEIRKPIFGFGRKSNDFGLGFYCTESENLSREWACQNNTPGKSNRYLLETDGLSIINLNTPKYSVMNWIAVLMNHRKILSERYDSDRIQKKVHETFYVDVDRYDVVKGYRADDSYFIIANRFIDGLITYRQLSTALRLGDFGEQVVLKSENAFDRLEFVSCEDVSPTDYYPAFAGRERKANESFRQLSVTRENDFDITDILEMDADDPRLF